MKFLFELFPTVVFFATFKLYGIYTATIAVIAATAIQVLYTWIRRRRVEPSHLAVLALILVFGGATLYFDDERFIKWKPTAVSWLFCSALVGSHFVGGKTLMERLMSAQVALPATLWPKLNLSWALFFLVMGAINLAVAFHFETGTWVNFKLFGILGLTLAFSLAQGFVIARHLPASSAKE